MLKVNMVILYCSKLFRAWIYIISYIRKGRWVLLKIREDGRRWGVHCTYYIHIYILNGQTALLGLWVHCGGSETLDWLASSKGMLGMGVTRLDNYFTLTPIHSPLPLVIPPIPSTHFLLVDLATRLS